MSIKIDDGVMSLEVDGRVIATASERTDGWWEVSHWPRFFDRNQAITALMVTELLESGRDSNDPYVRGLREELGRPTGSSDHHRGRRSHRWRRSSATGTPTSG